MMQIRVLGFAQVREILGASQRSLELPDGARLGDAWMRLEQAFPTLAGHRASVRIARNGRLADEDLVLSDGDEIAILPPVGGG